VAGTRFDAFISYSRGASQQLAVDLQSAIERFAKPWYRLRAVRVFRDDASMSANVGLWSTIEKALVESEWFVLIASPRAAASQWVAKELRWWLEHKSADRILLVLEEGELAWDWQAGDFDWSRTTAVGSVLSGAFAEEPRWVDLTWFEQPEGAGRDDPRWIERVADLAAAIRFAERDQLVGENVREHRRARRLLRAGIVSLSVLLVASLVASAIAISQSAEAQAQARVALARQLAAQALALHGTDIQLASLLAVEAYRLNADEQTEAGLFQTATASPYLDRTMQADEPITKVTGATDASTILAGAASGAVLEWDVASGERAELGRLDGSVSALAASAHGTVVVAASSTETRAWVDGAESSLEGGGFVAVSPDGDTVAVFSDGATRILSRIGNAFEPASSLPFGAATMTITADHQLVFLDGAGTWGRADLASGLLVEGGDLLFPIRHQGIAMSHDGEVVALADGTIDHRVVGTHGAPSTDNPDGIATSGIAGALGLALSGNGSRLANIEDNAMYVTEVRDPGEIAQPPLLLDGSGKTTPNALEFLGDRFIASVSGTQVLLWDLEQASRITRTFDAPVPTDCTACGPPVITVSPDGQRAVATSRSGGSGLTLYDGLAETGAVVNPDDAQFASMQAPVWLDAQRLAVFSPSAAALLVFSGPGLETVEHRIPVESAGVLASAVVDESTVGLVDELGNWILVSLEEESAFATGSALASVVAQSATVFSFAVAPDGSSAFVGAYPDAGALMHITAIDTASGEPVFDDLASAAAYAADSRLRVFVGDRVRVLDDESGELGEVGIPVRIDDRAPVALSPDGRILVNGGRDGSIEFVDLARWGSRLGSMAVPDEESAYSFYGFSADGTRLYTAIQPMAANDYRSSVRITDMTIDGWISALCATAGRDMTPNEWAIYSDTPQPENFGCER
jgi:WD40 repeat protein